MPKQIFNTIQDEIQALKRERNAVILAHNYQIGDIQDIADFTGDSLRLSQMAAKTTAEVIVFCGVHFMAETASILSPEKTVLIPDINAGCSLSGMVTPEQVRAWKKEHPNGVVVTYVNTSAAVKAESDYCCTSSNAVKVVEHIPADKDILFVPDFYLGNYVKQRTGRDNITIWKGYCHVHMMISPGKIDQLREDHPQAEFLMHPECSCMTKYMDQADQVLSTEEMVRYSKESNREEFVVATETGILHKMRKENPDKQFIPAAENAICGYMKMNTLEKIVLALEKMQYEVKVPQAIAEKALIPIQRMLDISYQTQLIS
ncbi:MAG: quinolinate synthase [Candidatus Omnitrophica bacterium CG11_big_fil_rev_8_21_14_0_20_45_26]|uniref:Quinolinate synthase n=1 Tax=Candidatus Abzuiibacterium crystallinum TaxID=1974748 RepID=A0A2H0LQG2_9BACT|nr:MAG: quinolinate synthase [Candidatus Omnitrophica bacterium CG11_big_fil_rev_8_21_14_0_20_45_26]PIW64130.1 MAG: quinolinate synthase [Candidatus Omnitrophica bacterium CG12_big_fil_rev_8_21_14_0_65_45_16]